MDIEDEFLTIAQDFSRMLYVGVIKPKPVRLRYSVFPVSKPEL